MKYLFWLLVIALVWWAWRRGRSAPPAQAQAEAVPQDMVACTHCGIHLPHDEAVTGTRGRYCSTAHRSAAGARNPD